MDTDGAEGDRTALITATDGHPFWVADRGKWVDAGDLTPGDDLRTPEGDVYEIAATAARTETTTVFNLTVAGIHTYFVLAGDRALLVHNSICKFWTLTEYKGQRIYQRDDLIDPAYVSPKDKYERTNLKRMQQGLAPMGPDDKPLNLHHMLQTQDEPIAEVTHSMHFGNYRQLHWKVGTKIPSGINRETFESGRRTTGKIVPRTLSRVVRMNGVEAVERMIELVRSNDDISNHADGCPPDLVSAAEEQLGAEFPPSYRRLIEEFGTCDVGGQEFLGVYRTSAMDDQLLGSVSETLEARANYGLPSELIVVMYDGMGGMVSLDISQRDVNGEAPVVVWSPGGVETLGLDLGSYALAVCERAVARRG